MAHISDESDFVQGLFTGVIPYLPGDALKIVLCYPGRTADP